MAHSRASLYRRRGDRVSSRPTDHRWHYALDYGGGGGGSRFLHFITDSVGEPASSFLPLRDGHNERVNGNADDGGEWDVRRVRSNAHPVNARVSSSFATDEEGRTFLLRANSIRSPSSSSSAAAAANTKLCLPLNPSARRTSPSNSPRRSNCPF